MRPFRVGNPKASNCDKVRDSNRLIFRTLATNLSLILVVGLAHAEDVPAEKNLEEDFLIYIAEMSINDGKIVDQLNMLDFLGETIETKTIGNDDTSPEKGLKTDKKLSSPRVKEETQ